MKLQKKYIYKLILFTNGCVCSSKGPCQIKQDIALLTPKAIHLQAPSVTMCGQLCPNAKLEMSCPLSRVH